MVFIGETSAMLLLAGGIYLLIRKVIKIHIPLAYIGMFAAMTFFLAPGHQFDIIYTYGSVRWWYPPWSILHGYRLCNQSCN